MVPTIDTARFTLLAKRLLAMGRSVFLGGPSGCGKTVLMSQIAAMGKAAPLAAHTASSSGAAAGVVDGSGEGEDVGAGAGAGAGTSSPAPPLGVPSLLPAITGEGGVFTVDINFSGRSTSAATQRSIESRLLKRHGTALGPPPGSKVGWTAWRCAHEVRGGCALYFLGSLCKQGCGGCLRLLSLPVLPSVPTVTIDIPRARVWSAFDGVVLAVVAILCSA